MRPLNSNLRSAQDVALLVVRVVVGVIFAAHGWQKLAQFGLSGTGEAFAGMGVPLPQVSAVVAAVIELGGGVLLIAGALTPVVGVLLLLDMLGAFLIVHFGAPVFVTENGWELVGALGAASLLLAFVGPGRYSIDALVTRRTAPAV